MYEDSWPLLVVCVPRVIIHGDGWEGFVFNLWRCSCACWCVCVCVCGFKTPPCVDSKLLRVCRQNTRVSCDTEIFSVPHHTHHHTNTHQHAYHTPPPPPITTTTTTAPTTGVGEINKHVSDGFRAETKPKTAKTKEAKDFRQAELVDVMDTLQT